VISANTSGCTVKYVFAHEMGHLLTNNAYHSWDGNLAHGLGHCDAANLRRSLMADDTTTGCVGTTRLLQFSNPERTWLGLSAASGTTQENNANRVAVAAAGADWRSPTSQSAGYFYPMDAFRILDTRDGTGGVPTVATSPLVGGQTYQLSALAGPMPQGALHAALNVTVISQGAAGTISVRQDSAFSGPAVGAFGAGQVKAIGTVVQLGTYGTIFLQVSTSAHVVIDVVGYFGGSATSAMLPLATPVRACDTRTTGYLCAAGIVPNAQSRSIPITNLCPGTTSVSGAIVNLTAVSAGAAGFLQARRDTGSPAGAWSNVNFLPGEAASNLVFVPVVNQSFNVYAVGGADVLVDLLGCFSSSVSGKAFHSYSSGQQRLSQVLSGTTPADATGVTVAGQVALLSVRASGNTAPTFLQAYVGSPPMTSTLNLPGPDNSNMTVVPVSASGTVTVRRGHAGSVSVVVDQFGYFS
jgi:hypothetical protein